MKEITLTERKTGREWGGKFSFKKYIPRKLNEFFNAERARKNGCFSVNYLQEMQLQRVSRMIRNNKSIHC